MPFIVVFSINLSNVYRIAGKNNIVASSDIKVPNPNNKPILDITDEVVIVPTKKPADNNIKPDVIIADKRSRSVPKIASFLSFFLSHFLTHILLLFQLHI